MPPDEIVNLPVPIDTYDVVTGEEIELTLNANKIIFREGEDSDYAFMIISGKVELTKEQDDMSIHLADMGADDIIGEMGVLDGSPRSATARAKTKVVVRRYDRNALMAKVHGDAAFALPIMNQLVASLRETSQRLAHSQFLAIRESTDATDAALAPRGIFGRIKIFFDADADINEFQPDAVEIERRRLPGAAVVSLFAIVGIMVGAVVWASVSEIDTKVMALGRVITTRPNIVLQPVETAVIRTMRAKQGDLVRAGQVLATLDPTVAEADVSASQATLVSLQAQERRLETELYDLPYEAFSPDADINTLEKEVYERRRSEFQAKLVAKEQKARQLSAQIRTGLQEAKDLAGQVGVLREIESMRTKLMNDGYGSKVNFLMAKNQRLGIEREQRRLKTFTLRLRHELKAMTAEEEAFASEWRSATASNLVTVRRQIDRLSEHLKKMRHRTDLVDITAPADGIVLEVAARTAGSVIQTAEPLFTIVPIDVPLEVEADIDPKDVGQMQVGDPVRIKLDSLPFQKHGMLTGVVRLIGEDTVEKRIGNRTAMVYQARVEITGNDLRNVPTSFHLMAGMTASAEIKVGKRRIITYFTYPIIRTLSTSLREP